MHFHAEDGPATVFADNKGMVRSDDALESTGLCDARIAYSPSIDWFFEALMALFRDSTVIEPTLCGRNCHAGHYLPTGRVAQKV